MAALSSIATQIEDLERRVTEMAERYGESPDSAIATELFGVERSLAGARRALQRASDALDRS
jgi:Mg2+ and Co2+ transporter CorA